MSAYVLIVMVYYHRAVAMHEFTSKDKCEVAAQAVLSKRIAEDITTFCVEK